MHWPNKVWYETENGWSQRQVTKEDVKGRMSVERLFSIQKKRVGRNMKNV